MLQELFEQQRRQLDYFYQHLDIQKCQVFVQKLLEVKGHIFFSGVGKSGLIAQKITTTLMSTGTKAFFLSPVEALHGDLGIVSAQDLVILISKSGQTRELLELVPHLRDKQACVAAISCCAHSRLIAQADFSIVLPCERELCPFDLAPTTSAQVQLLFGDVLAMALMQHRNFTLDQYAQNHPHGQIGRRANLKVRDLMLDVEKTPFCRPEDRLQDVLVELTDKRCGCLLVIDDQRQLLGIFTDGDLRRALQKGGESILQQKLEQLMTQRARSIHEDALAWDAVRLMEIDPQHPVMVLPVLKREKGEVVGIIKMHDLIQAGI
ncbi:MAG: KpsF/GutQ family sugar-phosphate isomerase [Verrucomicrobia bacterium]|nr:KpsF/GutQ family sugar-phosphate isomerase [Verrucomicrobiota bacterium]MBS0646606.1 KpsF/GutQ family sugar-phosphate isomerase [Verrucomicrobiota bacterium]